MCSRRGVSRIPIQPLGMSLCYLQKNHSVRRLQRSDIFILTHIDYHGQIIYNFICLTSVFELKILHHEKHTHTPNQNLWNLKILTHLCIYLTPINQKLKPRRVACEAGMTSHPAEDSPRSHSTPALHAQWPSVAPAGLEMLRHLKR